MCTRLPPSTDTDDGIGARGEDAGDSPRTPVGLLRVAGVDPPPRVEPAPSRGMCRGVVAATEHHARGPSEAPSREEQDDEEEYRRLRPPGRGQGIGGRGVAPALEAGATLEWVAGGWEDRVDGEVGDGEGQGAAEDGADGPLVDMTPLVADELDLVDPVRGDVGAVPHGSVGAGDPVVIGAPRIGGRDPGDEDVTDDRAPTAAARRVPEQDVQRRPGARAHAE